jgi:hypothetical protein
VWLLLIRVQVLVIKYIISYINLYIKRVTKIIANATEGVGNKYTNTGAYIFETCIWILC